MNIIALIGSVFWKELSDDFVSCLFVIQLRCLRHDSDYLMQS